MKDCSMHLNERNKRGRQSTFIFVRQLMTTDYFGAKTRQLWETPLEPVWHIIPTDMEEMEEPLFVVLFQPEISGCPSSTVDHVQVSS